MEVLGGIICIVLILVGIVGLLKDGRERGIGYVVLEIIATIVLLAMGL